MNTSDAGRRKLQGDIEVLKDLAQTPTSFGELSPELQQPLKRAVTDLFAKFAEAFKNPTSRGEELLTQHGGRIRSLLVDVTGEPVAEEAFLGSDSRLYSRIAVCHHIYCSPFPLRDRSPTLPRDSRPWTVKRQAELNQLIALFRRNNQPITPSEGGKQKRIWLNLSEALAGERVEQIPPKALHDYLKRKIGELNLSAARAFGEYQDNLSGSLSEWSRSFLILLNTLRNDQGQLQGSIDEWELLKQYEKLLRDEILIDPLEGTQLREDALLANDEKRSTFNLTSKQVLEDLDPHLKFQRHPVLSKFLECLEDFKIRLKPLRLHELRQAQEAREARRVMLEGAQAEVVRRAMERFREEGQWQMDRVAWRQERVNEGTQALADTLLHEDARIGAMDHSLQQIAGGISTLMRELFKQRSQVSEVTTDVAKKRREAEQLKQKVGELQRHLKTEIAKLEAGDRVLEARLQEVASRVEGIDQTQVALAKELEEIKRQQAAKRSTFLTAMLTIVSVGVGILTGVGVAIITEELALGALAGATTTVGINMATGTDTPFSKIHRTS